SKLRAEAKQEKQHGSLLDRLDWLWSETAASVVEARSAVRTTTDDDGNERVIGRDLTCLPPLLWVCVDPTLKKSRAPVSYAVSHEAVDLRSFSMGNGNRRTDDACKRIRYSICRRFAVGRSMAA